MRPGNCTANMSVHFLSLFRRRGFTRADRPDRLVSDYDTFPISKCQTIQPAYRLPFDNGFRLPGLSFREHFSDTNDHRKPGGQSRFGFSVNQFVRLAIKLPPLTVAGYHVAASDILDH